MVTWPFTSPTALLTAPVDVRVSVCGFNHKIKPEKPKTQTKKEPNGTIRDGHTAEEALTQVCVDTGLLDARHIGPFEDNLTTTHPINYYYGYCYHIP